MQFRSFLAIAGLFAFFGGVVPAMAVSLPDGLEERTIGVADETRHYLLYKPQENKAYSAMVIVLHGGGQSMRKFFHRRRSDTRRWLQIADQEGLLLVAPNGVHAKTKDPSSDRQVWNDLRRAREAGNSTADDVGFITTLIGHLASTYTVDPTRTYVTGASNGGMMSFRLLIERPDLFAAGATFIASLPKGAVPKARSGTPIMIMNGTEDRLILYEGGPVAGGRRGETRSSQATLDYWLDVNKANRSAATTRTWPDFVPNDGCLLVETVYPPGPGGHETAYVKMEGGGHIIPARTTTSLGFLARRVLGKQCRDADGVAMAWDFMKRHRLSAR